ncbi:Fanconi anemia group A protein [Lonchura striata]|uniref:Fanconi anemia group A protein n=1 Tax=Lonchura striata TaxID=40157 RepID=A0A218US95_9PASE|nr:Fanconi anemia group A protein [Lonchura striata domestica]
MYRAGRFGTVRYGNGREQASKLGVPTATLAAKNAVANMERICQDSASPSKVPLLNSDQREPPVLEAVWHLHSGDIAGLAELLERSPAGPAAVEWLCSSLCGLCEQAGDIPYFAIVFLQNGFEQASELGRKVEFQKVAYICHAVLQRMLAWVLDAVGKEKQEDVSMVQAVRFWLNVFNVSLYGSVAHPDSLRQFFRHTLTEVLTYNPVLKVSDAIQMQKEWSFTRTSPLLTTLYRKLLVTFSVKESICQLQQVLETHEVNWQHVLSCVSTLVVCQAEAEQLFKDLLSHLLLKAFGNYDMENMITAFLIARQAALEGPAVFMPYSEWFKASFGNAGGHHGSSKKSLVFLLEFLSELVPFEAAPYLKVHIMFPPFVPSKHRSLLLEYITLAKTRLADLKVAIEDMGLYEDLSAPGEAVQLPKTPDGRMAFIDSLKRADKIPSNLYSTYLQTCHAMKEKVLQDDSKAEPSLSKEPFEQLKAELAVLRTLVVDQAQWEEVAAQLAAVSDRLRGVLGDSSEEKEAAALNSPVQVAVPAPGLAPCHQSVVDLLLTSFCQTLLAASSFNPPDRTEESFAFCLREWLLMELEVCPEKDILSAAERQDFHYWAIYQRYLPAPSAAGGCDGDLEKACGVIINAILDSSQRLDLGGCGQSKMSVSPEILCRLQELVLELRCRPKLLPGHSAAQRHFLFEILQGRLTGRQHGSALGEQLWRQQELLLHRRILVGLPASTLITMCWKGSKTVLDCDSFFCFVNSELKNVSSRGYALSYDITAHFFRGLLSASLGCEDAAEGVNEALATCQTKCPVLLLSAAEGVDFQTSLEWSQQILQCLEGRGTSWPLLFHSEGDPGKGRVLRSAASQRHTRLLPLAFFSACEELDPELGATLLHFSRPAADVELEEELDLF